MNYVNVWHSVDGIVTIIRMSWDALFHRMVPYKSLLALIDARVKNIAPFLIFPPALVLCTFLALFGYRSTVVVESLRSFDVYGHLK